MPGLNLAAKVAPEEDEKGTEGNEKESAARGSRLASLRLSIITGLVSPPEFRVTSDAGLTRAESILRRPVIRLNLIHGLATDFAARDGVDRQTVPGRKMISLTKALQAKTD